MILKKVSVIVPVYKAEKSIKRCIEAILDQTYKNIELILVDDGSPDRSGIICDMYQNYDRVKIIHTPNKGVSHARNVGIDYATGDYIAFCDSDDFYDKNFIKKMIRTAVKYNSDIIVCGYYLEEQKQFKSSIKSDARFIGENEIVEHCSVDNEFGGFCWNKLYKAKVIGKSRFPEDMDIMEDTYFLFEVIQKANCMYYLNEALYYYCDNKDSAVRNISNLYSDNDSIKYIDAWEKILADFNLNKVSRDFIYVSMVKLAINFRRQIKQKKYSKNKKLIYNLNKIVFFHKKYFYACKSISWYEKCKWTIKFFLPKLRK